MQLKKQQILWLNCQIKREKNMIAGKKVGKISIAFSLNTYFQNAKSSRFAF